MSPKGDFRDELTDHFVADLNGENTYFMVIPMAIINEIAFFRIDNSETFKPVFSAIKKFIKKVVQKLHNRVFVLCNF